MNLTGAATTGLQVNYRRLRLSPICFLPNLIQSTRKEERQELNQAGDIERRTVIRVFANRKDGSWMFIKQH